MKNKIINKLRSHEWNINKTKAAVTAAFGINKGEARL